MILLTTSSGKWTPLCERVCAFLDADLLELNLDGQTVHGYRSPDSPSLWLRDHSDMLRIGRYLHADVKSAVDAFVAQQARNGRVFDFVMTTPLSGSTERENWEKWVRVPVEADVEYRLVKAAYLAWQATGDADWLRATLPALDRALSYTLTHPWRWDAEHGLVKRAYTIDTWDFDYTAGRADWLNFQITDQTYWGLFHGDNSGVYEAAQLLARMYRELGEQPEAERWVEIGDGLRQRANVLLFNGRFYTHFYKLTPVTIPGCNEAEQLSLSNPMAINRGLATHEIAVAILQEYQKRARTTEAFAEWFGIDPPFPDGVFGDPKLKGGAYINGGIFPLVGGELARAAFEHGFETYGVQTLETYRRLIADSGASYLWYFPDGTPCSVETSTSPEASPTDGWGSSAMLYALLEGLAGVQDRSHSFRRVRLAPRWVAAGEEYARVQVSYADSGVTFGYEFRHLKNQHRIELLLEGASEAEVELHLLVPPGREIAQVAWDGKEITFQRNNVENSLYLNATNWLKSGKARIEVRLASE